MLEATIGLNDVTNDKTLQLTDGAESHVLGDEGGPFTSHDLNFLKSLRISMEGQDEGKNPSGE